MPSRHCPMLGLEVKSQRTGTPLSMERKRPQPEVIILDDDDDDDFLVMLPESPAPLHILQESNDPNEGKRQRLETDHSAATESSMDAAGPSVVRVENLAAAMDAAGQSSREMEDSGVERPTTLGLPDSDGAGHSLVQVADPDAVGSTSLVLVGSGAADPSCSDVGTGDIAAKRLQDYRREWHQTVQQAIKEEEERASKDGKKTKKKSYPDMEAYRKMKAKNSICYPTPKIGNLEGMEVGFLCYSRAEMAAVGLHTQLMQGIDYIASRPGINFIPHESGRKTSDYRLPIATCIVMSGGYEDDHDEGDTISYTGSGGSNQKGDKRQMRSQEMNPANQALVNSYEQGLPIRVVRGHQLSKGQKSKSYQPPKVYTYNGLYKITDYNLCGGQSGFSVYKFTLVRIEGQSPLETEKVQFLGKKDPAEEMLKGIVSCDISNGRERLPIPASNVIDDPAVPPPPFDYLTENRLGEDVARPSPGPGCSCEGLCVNSETCACARLNSLSKPSFPYTTDKVGAGLLVIPSDVVYECGPNCKCSRECANRASQRMVRYRLQVFRTKDKGWGVKTWDYIPAGAPVCEYTGDVFKSSAKEGDNNYMFHLDCLQTILNSEGRNRKLNETVRLTEQQRKEAAEDPMYCIDAGSSGSVARFINHGCDYNLFVQPVLSSHHDLRLTRVVLVAAVPILPGTELSYDYGYNTMDDDARIDCYCGAAGCRKRIR